MPRRPKPKTPEQLYPERLEALVVAVWDTAMGGDLQAVEVTRRVLAQQAKFYGLDADAGSVPPITVAAKAAGDELSAYRRRYTRERA